MQINPVLFLKKKEKHRLCEKKHQKTWSDITFLFCQARFEKLFRASELIIVVSTVLLCNSIIVCNSKHFYFLGGTKLKMIFRQTTNVSQPRMLNDFLEGPSPTSTPSRLHRLSFIDIFYFMNLNLYKCTYCTFIPMSITIDKQNNCCGYCTF